MSRILSEVLGSFSTFAKSKSAKTTTFGFRLSTAYSVGLFSICVCVILMDRFYGNPIDCFTSTSTIWKPAMVLKCWMEGTYLDKSMLSQVYGTEAGCMRAGICTNHNVTSVDRITFKYYQWIVPMLILQSALFYLPYALWKSYENNTMNKLLGQLSFPVFSDGWENQRKNLIAYFKDVKEKYHREYALKYLASEGLALLCIVFNMLLTKWVIQNEKVHFWNGYGPAVRSLFSGDMQNFTIDASILFPNQAKCDFYNFGSSGGLQKHDVFCIMPQNIIIDKIFAFLYIWYILVAIFGTLDILYLIFMFLFKILRVYDIGHMLERTVSIRECKDISNRGDFGLWFTLTIYKKNLTPIQFQDTCMCIYKLQKNVTKTKKFDFEADELEKY